MWEDRSHHRILADQKLLWSWANPIARKLNQNHYSQLRIRKVISRHLKSSILANNSANLTFQLGTFGQMIWSQIKTLNSSKTLECSNWAYAPTILDPIFEQLELSAGWSNFEISRTDNRAEFLLHRVINFLEYIRMNCRSWMELITYRCAPASTPCLRISTAAQISETFTPIFVRLRRKMVHSVTL